MKQTEMIFSGFGGQGALFAGQVMAYAGMDNDKHVTWLPSYGPEMRGGTANVTVIIGQEEIGSPLVRHPQVAIAMNLPSFEKYQPLIKPGGLLIYNASLVNQPHTRTDIRYIAVRANDIAQELGTSKMANMVLVGALVAATQVLPLDAVKQALQDHLPKRKHHLLPANMQAIDQGAALAAPVLA